MSDIPFVVIGHGEDPPWIDLDNSCPTCGEPDLPLLDSVPPGISYIQHCDGVWVRGPLNLKETR
jgi:hypothetical protein